MALLASVSLATSALFALWGLSELISVVMSSRDKSAVADLTTLIRWVFVVAGVLIAAFVATAAFDLRANARGTNRRDEAVALFDTAVAGGAVLFFIGWWLTALLPDVKLEWIRDTTPIDRIAKIQLLGIVAVVLGTLALSSSDNEDAPRLGGPFGAALAYVLVAVPVAVGVSLFLRLHT